VPQSKPIEKPSDRFKDAMRTILSVSKDDLLKREVQAKQRRKARRDKSAS
jgi:hypothetical protein